MGLDDKQEIVRLTEQRDVLLKACKLALEWLDEVCNAQNPDMATAEGVAAYNAICAAIAQAEAVQTVLL